jgi:hypothetical protein
MYLVVRLVDWSVWCCDILFLRSENNNLEFFAFRIWHTLRILSILPLKCKPELTFPCGLNKIWPFHTFPICLHAHDTYPLPAPAALERGNNQSKSQLLAHQKRLIFKNFYSFSHIELRESGIENQEPFSHQSRKFTLLRGTPALWDACPMRCETISSGRRLLSHRGLFSKRK